MQALRRFGVGAYVRNFTDHTWVNCDVRSLSLRQIDARETEPHTYGVILSARFQDKGALFL